jgi:uncharacterized small protein (DUF1192 family)
MDFYDRTLIRLRRQYSKDEVVAALIKKLSETEINVGILKDEIDYLKSELQSDKEQKEIIRATKIEARKDELYKIQLERCRKQREEIKKLTAQRNDLIAKCFSLERKCAEGNVC